MRNASTSSHYVPIAAAIIAAAGASADVVEVGTDGGTADIGGAAPATITVKNVCKDKDGKKIKVEDIRITIIDPDGLVITGVDIGGTDKDHVDDNGDGNHTNADGDPDEGEDDLTDSTPTESCKSIITDGYIDKDATREITITFPEDVTPPPGTKVFIRFSDEDGSTGQHSDLCQAVPPFDPNSGNAETGLFYASAHVQTEVDTDPTKGVAAMFVQAPPGNPILDLQLPPEVPAFVDVQGEFAAVEFEQPLLASDPSYLRFTFANGFGAEPQPLVFEAFLVDVPAPPPPCLADFNEDGQVNVLDFVAYQQAYQLKEPSADINGDGILNVLDFVAFQAEFQKGCPEHVVLADDNFEDFTPGPICGQGGWEAWYINPDNCGTVTNEESFSIVQSLKLVGAEEAPKGDDAVRIIDGATEGVWHFHADTFVPADAYGRGWVVLLNTYSAGGDKNWSLALALDADQGLVQDNPLGQQDPPTLPLVVDRWVPIDVEVDLDNDICTVYYDGQVLLEGQSWSAGMNAPGKAAIEALHLDAGDPNGDGISAMFIDDVSLESKD
jgi:hypothetical protein